MTTLVEIWKEKKDFLATKSLSQIITISGEGQLKDGNSTSLEVRDLLNEIPSKKLIEFSDQCLNETFKDSGFALQEVINQYGKRLGFNVEPGLYRGKRNEIGFDGIWNLKDEHSFIVEIKTTDTYLINLDSIADYRERLIDSGRINKKNSSTLIIVGRQDTGGLESQIRGSKHAWSIRLLSIDSLTKLLELRATVNDNKILRQINEILKPHEYTRLDKLIDLLLLTAQDNQLNEEETFKPSLNGSDNQPSEEEDREIPVDYHEGCIGNISKYLKKTFIKQSKSTYQSSDSSIGLTCAVSKVYPTKHTKLYWYAFHPYQKEFLEEYGTGYVSFGCGDENHIMLIPLDKFLLLIPNMNTTTGRRMYWHVKIHSKDGRFEIEQPLNKNSKRKDITEYLIR